MRLAWESQAAFASSVTKENRKLLVFVQPSPRGWAALSLEIPDGDVDDENVLDNHAHKMIGRYPTAAHAFEAAESFAAAWLKGWKAAEHKNCECGEIPDP